eukprot:m.157093 g.157093  ORF g.157093 m.157093 type:complete len:830 (+) comp20844_c1_seq6:858-3347(+)
MMSSARRTLVTPSRCTRCVYTCLSPAMLFHWLCCSGDWAAAAMAGGADDAAPAADGPSSRSSKSSPSEAESIAVVAAAAAAAAAASAAAVAAAPASSVPFVPIPAPPSAPVVVAAAAAEAAAASAASAASTASIASTEAPCTNGQPSTSSKSLEAMASYAAEEQRRLKVALASSGELQRLGVLPKSAPVLLKQPTSDVNDWVKTFLRIPSLKKAGTLKTMTSVHDKQEGWAEEKATIQLPPDISASFVEALNMHGSEFLATVPEKEVQPSVLLNAFSQWLEEPLDPALDTADIDDDFGFSVKPVEEEISVTSRAVSWTYSSLTKMMFVNMDCDFPLRISYSKPIPAGAVVRVMPRFSKAEHSKIVAARCPNHVSLACDVLMVAPPEHLVRCNFPNAVYHTDDITGRHSVIISCEAGVKEQVELFRMMCFSSCAGGINRRPLELVFTLEYRNQIVGRQVLPIRVCACPGRDKKNAEKLVLKNDPDMLVAATGKKKQHPKVARNHTITAICKHTDDPDTTEYTVEIKGTENYKMVSKVVEALDAEFPHISKKSKDRANKSSPTLDDLKKITDVASWLQVWGLAQYKDIFLGKGYDDLELIEHLTAEDLDQLEIKDGAHRDRLLEASKTLISQGFQGRRHNCFPVVSDTGRVTRVTLKIRLPEPEPDPDSDHDAAPGNNSSNGNGNGNGNGYYSAYYGSSAVSEQHGRASGAGRGGAGGTAVGNASHAMGSNVVFASSAAVPTKNTGYVLGGFNNLVLLAQASQQVESAAAAAAFPAAPPPPPPAATAAPQEPAQPAEIAPTAAAMEEADEADPAAPRKRAQRNKRKKVHAD